MAGEDSLPELWAPANGWPEVFRHMRNPALATPHAGDQAASPPAPTPQAPASARAIVEPPNQHMTPSTVDEVSHARGQAGGNKVVAGLAICVAVLIGVVVFLLMDGSGEKSAVGQERAVAKKFAVEVGEDIPEFRGYWLQPPSPMERTFNLDDLDGQATAILFWSSRDEGVQELLETAARARAALLATGRSIRLITLNDDPAAEPAREALAQAQAEQLPTLWNRHPDSAPHERPAAVFQLLKTPQLFLVDERGALELEDAKFAELLEENR